MSGPVLLDSQRFQAGVSTPWCHANFKPQVVLRFAFRAPCWLQHMNIFALLLGHKEHYHFSSSFTIFDNWVLEVLSFQRPFSILPLLVTAPLLRPLLLGPFFLGPSFVFPTPTALALLPLGLLGWRLLCEALYVSFQELISN